MFVDYDIDESDDVQTITIILPKNFTKKHLTIETDGVDMTVSGVRRTIAKKTGERHSYDFRLMFDILDLNSDDIYARIDDGKLIISIGILPPINKTVEIYDS